MLYFFCYKKGNINCSNYGSTTIKRMVIHIAVSKTICNRLFVEGGQDWVVSVSAETLINKLLLKRISFSGTCRV